jgi:hypothetical protein
VIVGTKKNGAMSLYDVIALNPTQIKARQQTSQAQSIADPPHNETFDRNSAPDISIITQPAPKINPQNNPSAIDSAGRHLTPAQETFFADSVVRDKAGRLLPMYHGTGSSEFNVFDMYGGRFGLYGMGNYFTADKTVAESYAHSRGKGKQSTVYETYLNIKNPIDMDAAADLAQWKDAFIAFDLDDSLLVDVRKNSDAFTVLKEAMEADGVTVSDAAEIEMNMIEHMGYDGVTHIGGGIRNKNDTRRHRVYVAFAPEQIKRVNNANPTGAADIRQSIAGTRDIEAQLMKEIEAGDVRHVADEKKNFTQQKENFTSEQ